jgi:tetratricopeptide (TPR) repeat protein
VKHHIFPLFILILVLVFCPGPGHLRAREPDQESRLWAEVRRLEDQGVQDSALVRAWINLSTFYYQTSPGKNLETFKPALTAAEKARHPVGQGLAWRYYGVALRSTGGDKAAALEAYQKAATIFRAAGEYELLVKTMYGLSNAWGVNSNLPKALETILEAEKIALAHKLGPDVLASVYNNAEATYRKLRQYNKAIPFAEKSRDLGILSLLYSKI